MYKILNHILHLIVISVGYFLLLLLFQHCITHTEIKILLRSKNLQIFENI